MASNAYEPAAPPDEQTLSELLGDALPWWRELIERLTPMCAPYSLEWRYHAGRDEWSARVRRGTRIIVYLQPRRDAFQASFALGERAVAAAHAADLPDEVHALIDGARRYAEGRAVRIEVTGPGDVATVRELAAAKIAH